jgi:TctA family transporter
MTRHRETDVERRRQVRRGQIEGVIAPETAACPPAGQLLPMLALGIPGSPTAAVLLAASDLGLQPDAAVRRTEGLRVGSHREHVPRQSLGLIIVLTCPAVAAILRVPFSIIAPVIVVICAIGAYSVHSAMLDIWLMMLFGVIGYVKLDYPLSTRAGAGAGRPRGGFVPPGVLIAQGDMRIFFSTARRQHHRAGPRDAVLASGFARRRQGARRLGLDSESECYGWRSRRTRSMPTRFRRNTK